MYEDFGDLLQHEKFGKTYLQVLKIVYWEKIMHDATCKALEVALGEKRDAFNKWDEKTKKR